MGGGWNACSNCGMRGFGPGGGYYSQWAGATNGFGAGQRGWFGVPSANGYGMGWGGNALMGGLGSMTMGGPGMMGGGLGMLGGMFGGGMMGGQGYPGAMVQQPGVPPGNYAYGATRYGGGGAMGYPRSNGTYQGNAGPGYPNAQPGYRQVPAGMIDRSALSQATPRGAIAQPVYIQNGQMPMRQASAQGNCRLIKEYQNGVGWYFREYCAVDRR